MTKNKKVRSVSFFPYPFNFHRKYLVGSLFIGFGLVDWFVGKPAFCLRQGEHLLLCRVARSVERAGGEGDVP